MSVVADGMTEKRITYTIEKDGHFFLVEDVPARVDPQTGELLFSPETVERLQQLIAGDTPPVRMLQTPVFRFAV